MFCYSNLLLLFLDTILIPYLCCNHRQPALLMVRFSGCVIVITVGCHCLFWKQNVMMMMMMILIVFYVL